MTYTERKEKEKYLLYLIDYERLISLGNVANDFECSVRTVKRMLTSLRHEGYKICYCKKSNTYFLEE